MPFLKSIKPADWPQTKINMGNWRTVNIIGSMSNEDAQKVRKFLALDVMDNNWGCLHSGGICGLPNWGRESVSVVGNLGERGYDPDDVADALRKILEFAPSIEVKIHCGGDYESLDCIATVTAKDGLVTVGDPEIETLPEISAEQMQSSMFAQIFGRKGGF